MAKRSRVPKTGPRGKLEHRLLGPLIQKHPELLHALDKHGVTFCAGCYITLFSPLQAVAGYHAVPDAKKFLKDVRKAIAR